MADLRLPRFLTDKNSESREIALVRFAQDNNSILLKQTDILQQMAGSLQMIESMMFASLDYEKRKMVLAAQQSSSEKLAGVEATRESKNAENQKSRSLGSLAGAAAKLGLKGLLGAFLFGFTAELLQWGKAFRETREKFLEGLTKLQNRLDDWGDKIGGPLGGIVKSLIPISLALASVMTILGPARTIRLAFAPLTAIMSFFGTLGRSAKFAEFVKGAELLKVADFGKFLRFARVFGKAIPVVGEIIIILEGLIGGVTGAIEGWKNGGLKGAIVGGLEGIVHGIVDGLLGLIKDLEVWLLEKLGFDELAGALDNIDVTKLVQWCIDGVGSIFSTIGSAIGNFFKAIIDFDYMGFINKIVDNLPIPDVVKRGIKQGIATGAATARAAADFAGNVTGQAWDATKGAWNSATGWLGEKRDALDTAAAGAVRRRTAEMGVGKTPTVSQVTGAMPRGSAVPQSAIAASTGGMMNGTAASGRDAAAQVTGNSNASELAREAAAMGMTPAQINYTYETDKLIGAPQGATLAQLKQESGFRSSAVSPTGAVGIAQFTGIAVHDVLAVKRGVSPDKISKGEIAAAKSSLQGNVDKSLDFHRVLMTTIQKRKKTDWLATMRHYNGDVGVEKNGMQARDNYVARIGRNLGARSASPQVAAAKTQSSGSSLRTSTAAVTAAQGSSSGSGAAFMPVDNSRTNVNNQVTHQAANVSASTPVEFAPHVV